MTLTTVEKNAYLIQHGDVEARCLREIAKAFPASANRLAGIWIETAFNGRLSATMGRASFKGLRYKIEYSSKLYALATPEKIHNNMVHELCHVFAHALTGKMGHDRMWKRLMVICGQPPLRCYSVTKENFGENKATVAQAAAARKRGRRARYRAECGCVCGPVQRKRMLAGSVYRCRHGRLTSTTVLTEIK